MCFEVESESYNFNGNSNRHPRPNPEKYHDLNDRERDWAQRMDKAHGFAMERDLYNRR